MRKAFGLALALTLTLTLSAAAADVKGTVRSVEPADHSFTLDDGTRLWVEEGSSLGTLAPGDSIQASYEVKGDRKVVTVLDRRAKGPDGQETTNFGSPGSREPLHYFEGLTD